MPRKWVPERMHVVGTRPELPVGVVKSAGRVLQIFEFFDEVRREANVVEICATLGYPQSSTSALLRSLVALGHLHYNRLTRMYVPTDRVALLGNWVNDRLFRRGQLVRLMQRVHAETGQAVILATRRGHNAKYIHVIQATALARLHITLGTERPLVSSGTGLALLSTYGDVEIRNILRAINAYDRKDKEPIVVADLLAEVADVRRKGYACVTDMVIKGGGMIAMPIDTGAGGQPLVLGLGGVSAVLRESEDEFVQIMRRAVRLYLDGVHETEGALPVTVPGEGDLLLP